MRTGLVERARDADDAAFTEFVDPDGHRRWSSRIIAADKTKAP